MKSSLLIELDDLDPEQYGDISRLLRKFELGLRQTSSVSPRIFAELLDGLIAYISINQIDLDITQKHRAFIRKLKGLVDFWTKVRK